MPVYNKLSVTCLLLLAASTAAFQMPSRGVPTFAMSTQKVTALHMASSMTTEELKSELTAYLKKRAEENADESAKQELGKVVGGTKGNAVLEFISGAPNREFVLDELPDVFDYSELGKYGYAHLVTPIMDSGGRLAMYDLMDMPTPATKDRIKKVKKVPKLVIDRTGETDQARYSGLKVNQILDDDEMGRRLEEVMKKEKEGTLSKAKLLEEEYVQPFADKRNTGPSQTPDWTPEMLDEEGIKAGKAAAWARKAKEGTFKTDPYEMLSIEGSLQVYSIFTTIFVAFAFGNSTKRFFDILQIDSKGIVDIAQGPALAIVLASIGSCVLCSMQASGKNRSGFVWGVKGFAGGPLALLQLKDLDTLMTQGDFAKSKKSA